MSPGGCPGSSQVWTESHWLHTLKDTGGWRLSEEERGRGTGRESDVAVDKSIMEKSAKSQGNELSDLAKIINISQSIPPPSFLFLSLYDRLSHIGAQSFTFTEMPWNRHSRARLLKGHRVYRPLSLTLDSLALRSRCILAITYGVGWTFLV